MRQLWRFARLVVTTLVYTAAVDVRARLLPARERPRYRARKQQSGCAILCRILGIEVGTVDVPPADGGTELAVCNHFGVLDPLVLASRMPVAFVAKAEVRGWPVVGWITRTYGVIFVERERRTATASFVEAVQARLGAGVRVLVFPEGGITTDDRVAAFKTGAFAAVAGDAEATVLPLLLRAVRIDGRLAVGETRARVVWGPGEPFLTHFWRLTGLRRVEMEIRGGAPTTGEGHDRKTLARYTHERVSALAAAVRPTVPEEAEAAKQ